METFVETLCRALAWAIPNESLRRYEFMQRALLGMMLIAPLCSTIGVQVVNFRMAFFSEAVGHSAYTGIGLGLLFSLLSGLHQTDPSFAGTLGMLGMVGFGALVAVVITIFRRHSNLSSDTIIGVFSASVIAIGLTLMDLVAKKNPALIRDQFTTFLRGNVLTITSAEVFWLLVFFIAVLAFQLVAYNRLLFIGINSPLARTMRIRVAVYEYLFAILLAVIVMFAIRFVGALLVAAMLVIPAATARNLARSAGSLFWWGLLVSLSSGIAGLLISDWAEIPSGAITVLLTTAWFLASSAYSGLAARR